MLACVMEPCTKAHSIIKKLIQFTVGFMDSNSLDSLLDPHPQAWSCNHPEAVGTSDDLSFVKSVNCITCCNNWMLNVGLCHGIMHRSAFNYYNKWYNLLLGIWMQELRAANHPWAVETSDDPFSYIRTLFESARALLSWLYSVCGSLPSLLLWIPNACPWVSVHCTQVLTIRIISNWEHRILQAQCLISECSGCRQSQHF